MFISNAKRGHLQCQKLSSLAQNSFVASNRRFRLQSTVARIYIMYVVCTLVTFTLHVPVHKSRGQTLSLNYCDSYEIYLYTMLSDRIMNSINFSGRKILGRNFSSQPLHFRRLCCKHNTQHVMTHSFARGGTSTSSFRCLG